MNNVCYNVKDFGARGDGQTDDTLAIRQAIAACSARGGTVFIPPGHYLSACLHLVSNLTLHLDAGAVIYFSTRFADYPPVPTRWEGVECYGFTPLVYGSDLENVHICGAGILDGQGQPWWDERARRHREGSRQPETETEKRLAVLNPGYAASGSGGGGRETQFLRPPLLQLKECRRVIIEGLILRNSPFWNTHLIYCDNVSLQNLTFRNPPNAPNTDGLDLDSCTNMRVTGCHFDVGDDCICLKSGIDADGRRVNRPTENITISNCTMLHGHGGVVIGSESAAGVRNVTITNCVFDGTDRGLRIKSRRGRGGVVEDITASNLIMRDVLCPVVMNLFYQCGAAADDHALFSPDPRPVSEQTPHIRNISLSGITARNVRAAAGFIHGLPELPIRNLTFNQLDISLNAAPDNPGGIPGMVHGLAPMRAEGFICRYVEGLKLNHIHLELPAGKAAYSADCPGIHVHELDVSHPDQTGRK